jgi:hypothetical protein
VVKKYFGVVLRVNSFIVRIPPLAPYFTPDAGNMNLQHRKLTPTDGLALSNPVGENGKFVPEGTND